MRSFIRWPNGETWEWHPVDNVAMIAHSVARMLFGKPTGHPPTSWVTLDHHHIHEHDYTRDLCQPGEIHAHHHGKRHHSSS
jgi:hypothetical protein